MEGHNHRERNGMSVKVKGTENITIVNPSNSKIYVNSNDADEDDDSDKDSYEKGEGRASSGSDKSFLERCRAEILQFYRTNYSTVQLLPWDATNTVLLNDIYSNNTLKQYIKLGTCLMEWKTTAYEELFRRQKQWKLKRRILVEGKSGSGKSTLAAKMVHDWTIQDPACILCTFKLLFILDLQLIARSDSLTDAIFNQILPDDSNIAAKELGDYIWTHPGEVLIILNSYDESALSAACNESESSRSEVCKILCNRLLRDCQVVVFTRPWRAEDFRKLYDDYSHVEILGYSKAASQHYIHKFFSHSPSEAQGLIDYLASSDDLSSLACTPMLTALFCLLWEERDQEIILPETLSGIYDQVLMYLFNRHYPSSMGNISPTNLPADVQKVLLTVGKLGLDGLVASEPKLMFEASELERDTMDEACRVGIMSRGTIRKKLKVKQYVWFVHKTFQEKCAAFYLASLLNEDDQHFLEYISMIKSAEDVLSLQYLILFACSMSETVAKLIANHLAKLYRSDLEEVTTQFYEDQEHLHYDIRDRYKSFLEVCLKCTYESGTGSLLSEEFCCIFQRNQIMFNCADSQSSTFRALTYFVRNACTLTSNKLHLNLHVPVVDDVKQADAEGNLSRQSSSCSSTKSIHSQLPLVRLLHFYNMTLEHVAILTSTMPFLTSLEKLCIDGVYDVSASSIDAFANNISCQESLVAVSLVDFLCDCSPIISALKCPLLQEVHMCWIAQPEFTTALASTLQFMPSLRVLQLSNNSLKPCHVRTLAHQLKHVPALSELSLSWNHLGNALEELAANLNVLPRLEKLHLSHTELNSQGVIKLAANLVHIPLLTHIDLSDNLKIGKEGFVAFFVNIHHLTKLEYLDLEDSIVYEESIQSAAENLRIETLSWIDLSARFLSPVNLSASTCSTLATMLTSLPLLTEVYLEHAYIANSDGWRQILSAAQENTSIKLLRMTSKCVSLVDFGGRTNDSPSCLDLVGW